jgi:hypothetical protein
LLVANNLPATLDKIRAFMGNPADLRILYSEEKDAPAVIYQIGTIDEKELLARLDDFQKSSAEFTAGQRSCQDLCVNSKKLIYKTSDPVSKNDR